MSSKDGERVRGRDPAAHTTCFRYCGQRFSARVLATVVPLASRGHLSGSGRLSVVGLLEQTSQACEASWDVV